MERTPLPDSLDLGDSTIEAPPSQAEPNSIQRRPDTDASASARRNLGWRLRALWPDLRPLPPRLRTVLSRLRTVLSRLRTLRPDLRAFAPRLHTLWRHLQTLSPRLRALLRDVRSLARRLDTLRPPPYALLPRPRTLRPDLRAFAPPLPPLWPHLRNLPPRLRPLLRNLHALGRRLHARWPDLRGFAPRLRGLPPRLRSLRPELSGLPPRLRAFLRDLRSLARRLDTLRPHPRLGALVSGVAVLVIVGLAVGGSVYYRAVEGDIRRVDTFADLPKAERPQPVATKAVNLLILGSDSRSGNLANSRADTIILAHLRADRRKAQLMSIPRDTWVPIPRSADGRSGGRNAKINAAFAWGGTPLMVRTVERFTGVRVDHVVLIDFAGVERIVDALGGVEVRVDRSFTSIARPFRQFTTGTHRMDGAAALDYARQRQQFPDGDFARIRHQQAVLKAVLNKAATSGLLTNPARLDAFLRAVARAITVDKALSIFQMAAELRHLRGDDITFLTSPSSGTGRVGGQSVVLPDWQRAAALFDAIKRDQADAWFNTSR